MNMFGVLKYTINMEHRTPLIVRQDKQEPQGINNMEAQSRSCVAGSISSSLRRYLAGTRASERTELNTAAPIYSLEPSLPTSITTVHNEMSTVVRCRGRVWPIAQHPVVSVIHSKICLPSTLLENYPYIPGLIFHLYRVLFPPIQMNEFVPVGATN
jgi:hypothetical protein